MKKKSNTLACSQESEDSSSVSILSHSPRTNDPKKGGSGPLISNKHCFTIDRTPHLVVLGSQKLIDTQANSSQTNGQTQKL